MEPVKILGLLKKEYPDVKYYLDFSNPLELLVAAILSAQVRDTVVNAATKELFKRYKTAKDYAEADEKDILKYVNKVTFASAKVKNIKKTCSILAKNHGGRVPQTMEELTALPGVGRKTANVIMQNAFDIVEGVVVDTHVIRLSFRLGWTKETKPEKIEKDLMRFPKQEWKEMPHLLKSHGRAVCTAPVPYCSKCILQKVCPKDGVTKSN